MHTSAGRDGTVAEHLFQANRPVFDRQAAVQVLDHLADGHGFFVHIQNWARAGAVENLLESLDQVDHVGGELGLGAFGVHELADCRIAQDRVFDLLFLHQHLRGGFEFLVFEQAVDEFVARIFLASAGASGSRGSSIFDLM